MGLYGCLLEHLYTVCAENSRSCAEISETLGLKLDHFPGLGLDLGLENTHFPGLGLEYS